MADNVALTLGDGGFTAAADEIGAVKYQRVKLSLGADGTAVDAVAGTGAMSTAVQRVTLATDDPAVVDLAAIEVLLATIAGDTTDIEAAVEILDNAIAGNEMQVDVITVPALVASTASIGGTKDNGPHWTSVFGVSGATFLSSDATTAAAVTDVPTGGQKLVITDIVMSTSTAMFLLFEEETSGTDILKIWLPASGTYQFTPRSRIKLATADKKLTVDASVAGAISVLAFYYSEA